MKKCKKGDKVSVWLGTVAGSDDIPKEGAIWLPAIVDHVNSVGQAFIVPDYPPALRQHRGRTPMYVWTPMYVYFRDLKERTEKKEGG